MKFARLSKRAKQAAIDIERVWRAQDQDWWDCVYDDAVRIGALMGIEIGTHSRRTMNGKEVTYPEIWFSGFSSQGDGACYEGRYQFEREAPAKVREHACQDEELHRIVDELTALQIATKLAHNWTHSVNITQSENYSHSHSMQFEFSDWDGPDVDSDDFSSTQAAIIQLLRDFADWIYKQLEAEYDHFTGDESITEYLAESDLKFDSAGAII